MSYSAREGDSIRLAHMYFYTHHPCNITIVTSSSDICSPLAFAIAPTNASTEG
jgi:hypothetical protein